MSSCLIDLRNVSHSYVNGSLETPVLRDINLTIASGEMVAIVGKSGSGKSTLLNILGCLDLPSSGQYRVAERDITALNSDELAAMRREYFGFIFQRYDLLPSLTALENVVLPAIYTGEDLRTARERSVHLLDSLGLEARLHHKPSQLSGGQQQRVAIARALINGGFIILADEPTGALDSTSRSDVLRKLRELNDKGHTVIIVTHDMCVAEFTDRVISIADGRIVADRKKTSTFVNSLSPIFKPIEKYNLLRRIGVALHLAKTAIRSYRLRTALTMIGIVIGVASVILVTEIGEGAKRRVLSDLEGAGANSLDINPGYDWGDDNPRALQSLSRDDLRVLETIQNIDSVNPIVFGASIVKHANIKISVSASGVGDDYFRAMGTNFLYGTTFSKDAISRNAQVAILDQNLSKHLFGNDLNPIGKIILVGQIPVYVVGVVQSRTALLGEESLRIYLPYTTMMARLRPQNHLNKIMVRFRPNTISADVEALERLLIKQHRRKDFFITSNDEAMNTVKKTATTLTLMISAIAFISLVVGGVGVMNIMLVTVSERTREIGLRLAVGARQGDIRQQFLIEASVICLVGGVVGIAIAWLVGHIFSSMQSDIFIEISYVSILGACITSVGIGILFGFIPANNAARLRPVIALARD